MPDLPKECVKLYFAEFLQLRPNAAKRIINPQTGHQYEITQKEVDYICPICRHIQAAPYADGVEYECPKCKWHYKVYDEMLAIWNPKNLGVETYGYPPGAKPATIHKAELEGGTDTLDPEKVQDAYDKSTRQFKKAEVNNELDAYGKRIQILTPKKGE